MGSVEDKINELEEEITKTKYNKATQHHIGLLKARIAKLKEQKEVLDKKSGGPSLSYAVKKTGDATVLFVGFPSAGKSTLLNRLTNADSKVAAYEFTTLDVIPGMLEYKGAKIQLFDIPGIVEGAASGKGRGKEILSVLRGADALVFLVDLTKPQQIDKILDEIYKSGLRVNTSPPNVVIKRKISGGLSITATSKFKTISKSFAKEILQEYGVHNADVIIRQDLTVDQLIDVISNNRRYIPAIIVFNKKDLVPEEEMKKLVRKYKGIAISAFSQDDFSVLKNAIFNSLSFIRVYLKKIGEKPDLKEPLILKSPHTIKHVCKKLHKDFVKNFLFAKIWGKSAKFDGQTVGINQKIQDEDIVELHIRR